MSGINNFSINKKHGAWIKFLIGALALFILLAVLNFFSSGIRNVFYAFSAPVQKNFWVAGESSSGFLGSFVNAGSLAKQNQNLSNQNQELQAQIANLQSALNGNVAQSAVSMSCQNNGFKLLMAGVVGLDNQDILSINKGSADGVIDGMPVISQQGALYGKVFKVYKNYSQVMLISNKSSVISVKVQQQNIPAIPAPASLMSLPTPSTQTANTTKPATPPLPPVAAEIDGVAKGTGKLGLFLDLVPIDSTINSGDILVTSALEGGFPKDLLVGTITKIQKNDQDPHQMAGVKPFLNSSIDNLFVITNYNR